MKKILCVVLMGVLGLSGSLWAIGDEQEDCDARLLKAVQNGDFEGAQAAIEAGADVNMMDAEGRVLLFSAVMRNYSEMVQLLLDQGARMHIPIDNIREQLLQQGYQEDTLKSMSDSDVAKVFRDLAIKNNTGGYGLHLMFENIAKNPNEEEAYAEAVAFIRGIKDKHFTIEGQQGISRYAGMHNIYMLPLQHLIVRFSDEATVTLFLKALKKVCGEQEATQILFSRVCKTPFIRSEKGYVQLDSIFPPFEMLLSGCCHLSGKERLLSFFDGVDAVFGNGTVEYALMQGDRYRGLYLHYLLSVFFDISTGSNRPFCKSYTKVDFLHSVPVFLEAVHDYLGEAFLQAWFNSPEQQGYYPLYILMGSFVNDERLPILYSSEQYLEGFYSSLNAILKTAGGRLYCAPMLVDIEEDLGEGQDVLVLAIHLLKEIVEKTKGSRQEATIAFNNESAFNFLSDAQRLDLLLESEGLLKLLVDNLPSVENDKALQQLVDAMFRLIEEGRWMGFGHINQNQQYNEKYLFAKLLCQIKAIGDVIPLWKGVRNHSKKVKSARSVIPATDESKEKPVHARPSDEGSEDEDAPPRKKQRTLLEEFNREGDDDDDGDTFEELYSDDDDGWEYTETEYVDPGVERVRMSGELEDFGDAMRGVDFGYGEHGEAHRNGGAHQGGSY